MALWLSWRLKRYAFDMLCLLNYQQTLTLLSADNITPSWNFCCPEATELKREWDVDSTLLDIWSSYWIINDFKINMYVHKGLFCENNFPIMFDRRWKHSYLKYNKKSCLYGSVMASFTIKWCKETCLKVSFRKVKQSFKSPRKADEQKEGSDTQSHVGELLHYPFWVFQNMNQTTSSTNLHCLRRCDVAEEPTGEGGGTGRINKFGDKELAVWLGSFCTAWR